MLEQFPQTSVGKVDRIALKRLYDRRIDIKSVTLYRTRQPYNTPIKTPKREIDTRESFFVELEDWAGRTGIGECVSFTTNWYLPETLGDDFRTALAGDSKEFRESSSSLMFAFLLAILLIYLILAAQFESFKDPLVIMLTVPLAIAGALVFMWGADQTMNIFSQIGIIMLIGLVAKNGILIVEFANQKQEAGIDKLHAIEEASLQRLRPILMTSASTILGLLPLTVATGEGANGRIAMGIAVVGGMVVSTLLTLYIVPAIYSYVSTDRSKKQK